MPEYTVVKTLNNNVILVTDRQTSRELILIGKGIGFGKREGQAVSIPDEDIEKSFVAYNEKDRHAYYQLINQVDSKVIGVSEEIIALAEQQLGQLNSYIHIALTDHIAFTLDRIKKGLKINNPFLFEIKALYPEEFRVGQMAAEIISDRLNVEVSEAETGFIALHFHSARQNKKAQESLQDARLIKEMVQLIQDKLSITLEDNDLIYTRLLNHLRITIQRINENKHVCNPLLASIRKQFKHSFAIAKLIGQCIEKEKGVGVGADELGYLALHIERIKEAYKTK